MTAEKRNEMTLLQNTINVFEDRGDPFAMPFRESLAVKANRLECQVSDLQRQLEDMTLQRDYGVQVARRINDHIEGETEPDIALIAEWAESVVYYCLIFGEAEREQESEPQSMWDEHLNSAGY